MRILPLLAGFSILALTSLSSQALEAFFSGFGTAGFSCFSSEEADYVNNLREPRGPGRSGSCDAGLDSVAGLQLDLVFNDRFEFGMQGVVERNADDSYRPDFNVAQLRWRIGEQTTLRIGRSPYPAFLYSESKKVHFTMPWVRPPVEVYGAAPFFTQDGVEFLHMGRISDWRYEWQVGLSRFAPDIPDTPFGSSEMEGTQVYSYISLEQGDLLLKLGYSYNEATLSETALDLLLDGLRAFGPGSPQAELADDLALDDSPAHFVTLGLRHDTADWLLVGEFAYHTIEGFYRDQYGAYFTLGRRFGPWMPYATLGRRWTSGSDSDDRAGPLSEPVAALLASSRFDSSSLALGLSRELSTQSVLKLQVDWIRPDKESWGLYTNQSAQYDFVDPDNDILLTLSLDFVF